MPSRDRPPGYCAYLLRCWREPGTRPGPAAQRFSLEDPHTGERQGFASLQALVAFLETELADGGDDPEDA